MILNKKFYNRSAVVVARELLGCMLVRRIDGVIYRARIVETEGYEGFEDLASHASRGRTARNAVMFGEPGHFYVYFTYGMHYMMNIVTGPLDYPAAVLIRAVEPFVPALGARTDGPARLTKAMRVNREFNGFPVYNKTNDLWLESGVAVEPSEIVSAKRVGIDYAGDYKDKLWRFYIKDNKFVSKNKV